MKKVAIGTLLSAMIVFGSVNAAGNFYTGSRVGVDFQDGQPSKSTSGGWGWEVSRSLGPAVGIAAGYEFESGWRVEAEGNAQRVTYRLYEVRNHERNGPLVSSQCLSLGLMCNVGANLPSVWKLHPFVLGGVGAATVGEKVQERFGASYDKRHYRGAGQILAGIEYPIRPATLVGVQYRLVRMWDAGHDHAAEFSVRQKF